MFGHPRGLPPLTPRVSKSQRCRQYIFYLLSSIFGIALGYLILESRASMRDSMDGVSSSRILSSLSRHCFECKGWLLKRFLRRSRKHHNFDAAKWNFCLVERTFCLQLPEGDAGEAVIVTRPSRHQSWRLLGGFPPYKKPTYVTGPISTFNCYLRCRGM